MDNISSYGLLYQRKVIYSLINDSKFLDTISDILSPEYFEKEANQWIIETIINYHNSYRTSPTMEVFKIELDKINNDITKKLIIDELKECYLQRASTDLDIIKDNFLEFCRNQKMKAAIMNSADLIKVGNYEQIKLLIDEALKAGVSKDLGHNYKDEVVKRLTETVRDTVPTAWDCINDVMSGGLASGELGIIIAPPGVGKSWFLSKIGLYAIKQGIDVVHYTLELRDMPSAQRYDTCLIGIPPQDLKDYPNELKKAVSLLKGNLYIKYYNQKTASCNTFAAHLDHLKKFGINPGLIIIDYGDLVKNIGKVSGDAYFDLGNVFSEMRTLAGTHNIPVWTATQSGRKSIDLEIIHADKVSESFAKIMIADFIMSLSRKDTDKLSHTGRFHIIKNRFGPDGMTFPSNIDYKKGKIDIYDSNSLNGIDSKKNAGNGETLMKKKLSSKYSELMG